MWTLVSVFLTLIVVGVILAIFLYICWPVKTKPVNEEIRLKTLKDGEYHQVNNELHRWLCWFLIYYSNIMNKDEYFGFFVERDTATTTTGNLFL